MHSLFIGRFQPFHNGHREIVDRLLEEDKPVVIGIRDTKTDTQNPYSIKERRKIIRELYGYKVKILVIPDIMEVCYGRKVGYKIRRVRLNRKIEDISASKLRNNRVTLLWLTGNVGSGKTSLAYLLRERLKAVILDGNEMRSSISLGAGFSKKDREEHNLRVARLAKVLHTQGNNVVVSVIAPFQSTRDKIEKIIKPKWVHLVSPKLGKDKPYEPPKNPFLRINPKKEALEESLEKIVRSLYI